MNTLSSAIFPNSDKKDGDELPLALEEDELQFADEEDGTLFASEDQTALSSTSTLLPIEDDQPPFINPIPARIWKVVIIDDDPEVHEVTQFALQDFTFRNKPLTFLSAYSGQEAQELLKNHLDAAVIFLDVVMEENDSGLKIVKYIRETLQNHLVRIILRTGQPGEAPEEKIIVDYDINDYKLKTDLTQRKLFVTMIAALRAYYDLMALEINKLALKQTLEAMPVGVCVLEAKSKKPTFINQQARKLFGKGVEPQVTADNFNISYQMMQAGSSEWYPLNQLPLIRALQGQSSCVNDIEIRQADQIIPIESCGTPIFDEKQQVVYALSVFQDITERQRAEANKIRLVQEEAAKEAALRHSEEIAAKNADLIRLNQEKNEFIGVVAHDLKNPLSGLKGYAEDILDSFDELTKEELIELVSKIKLGAIQMFNLVVNLLDINAIESGKLNFKFEAVDIIPIMQKVLNNYQERAKAKNIKLQLESQPPLLIALVDKNTCEGILDNLVSNAIKYSPLNKNIYIRLCQRDSYIRSEVQDEGTGLSESDLPKLFGKFTRLSSKPTGGEHSTGLGLFIVKKLVEAMKGKVWCESQLGQGATFIVEFPTP
ncbi:response regulator receiver protein [Thioploca ingrica]|uniref:histidine kinase n=1 Tax=Thioploca ingrica TaxID=40754 RepID=A0A090AFJ8_9GAMM|nr:response regulator receiver protein [Thioploca ingrica]